MHPQWEQKVTLTLAVCVTVMICISRLSMAMGSVLNGVALLIGMVLYYKNKETFYVSKEAKGYLMAFGVFALSTIPSIVFSAHPMVGVKEFFNMWVWRFIVFVLIVGFLHRRDYLVNMLIIFLFVFSIDCFVAMGQTILNLSPDNRGWGLGGNSLILASIMCMLLPIVLVILYDPRFDKGLKNVSLMAVLAIGLGLIANKSRGAWLTVLIMAPLAAGRYLLKNVKYLVIFLCLAGCLVGYMGSQKIYVERFSSIINITTNDSNTARLWVWNAAKKMVQEKPAVGVGLGQFRENYVKKYRYTQFNSDKLQYKDIYGNLVHSHNNFVQIAAECGLIGLLGLAYFVLYMFFHSLKNWLNTRSPYDLMILTMVLGYFVIFGQFDYSIDYSAGMRIFWFLLAIILQLKEYDRDTESQERTV